MLGPSSSDFNWPDYETMMDELLDGEAARDFLVHIIELGYVVKELDAEGFAARDLPDGVASIIAREYWPLVFLAEYPDYGAEQ